MALLKIPECAALIEILHRKDELADVEMMNVYYKGCADAEELRDQ